MIGFMNTLQEQVPPVNLQDVLDELAETLGRNVAIDTTFPTTVAASGRRSESGRLAVPIRSSSGQLGTLWLAADEGCPLTPAQYAVIDIATGAARHILSQESGASEDSSHAAVMLRLLSDDPLTRRRAFAQAASRRWLERGDATLVRAIALDPKVGVLERLAFARHLAALRTVDLTFVGLRDGALCFVGRPTLRGQDTGDTDRTVDVIKLEAGVRGLRLLGIGSARLDRKEDDLAAATDRARRAAEIVAWLPHLNGVADISQLGAWVLLDSIDADDSHLGMFSPAAVRLWEETNVVQLETVETFLDCCGRVREACELLHIHRTTLYYRLDNLPETVRTALADGVSRSALHICLKLLRYWRAAGRI